MLTRALFLVQCAAGGVLMLSPIFGLMFLKMMWSL